MSRVGPADVGQKVGDWLSAIGGFVGRFSAIDWILVGCALALILYAWVRAASFARLGAITINDLKSDGTTMAPNELRADLQRKLGERGLLPPSGVPGGSPTKENLSAAVAAAPVAQAAWLGALINLVPFPAASTSFTLSGTLSGTLGGASQESAILCELVCQGPKPTVKLLAPPGGSDWSGVVDTAAKTVYRAIAETAPAIFPRWAQWASNDALTAFGDGLKMELGDPAAQAGAPMTRLERYNAAYALYRHASDLDPDNMLVRLRTANVLEQMVNELGNAERPAKRLEALEAYVSIRLRQPMIFEAGYRASVLLSRIAQNPPDVGRERDRLAVLLGRLEAEYADRISVSTWRKLAVRARRFGMAIGGFFRAPAQTAAEQDRRSLVSRMERAAGIESRMARRRLLPWWTAMREGRFRHRFEPTGQARRQLRKALGISQMCIRARRAGNARRRSSAPADFTQLLWRGWVFWRYLAGRSNVAGWQAHYNAAAFYALLPSARDERAVFGGERLRVKALRHLARALDQADDELQCRYVRDDDPDLYNLRSLSKQRFRQVLGFACPDDLVVHFHALLEDPSWTFHVWGDAIAPSTQARWAEPLLATEQQSEERVFRIRIFDENKPLAVLAHSADRKAKPVWTLTPVLDTSEERLTERWTFTPVDVNYEVWLYPGDATIHKAPRLAAASGA